MAARGYRDRTDAGRRLAPFVADAVAGGPVHLVLGLARGGVPVAATVAEHLGAPLEVLVVRKIGVPGHEELALGAVASPRVTVRNDDVIAQTRTDEATFAHQAEQARREWTERERELRGERSPLAVAGRTVVVVDDGLATGASMRAAVRSLRELGVGRLVVAVPVGAPDVCAEMARIADDAVCPLQPSALGGVGRWYARFDQTSTADVRRLVQADRTARPTQP